MESNRIGKRGTLFIFELDEIGVETSNILGINGVHHWFVIDTFWGPEAISKIQSFLMTDFSDKPTVVINTHAHFDHIWGNCAFSNATIIGHRYCRQGILRPQQVDFVKKNEGHQWGTVDLKAPQLTFEKRLNFEEDGVELFHSPGHTRDSISCIDHQDQILLVGDNIARPIPSIYPGVQVESYVKTLEKYLVLGISTIISSHYNEIGEDLIHENLAYLRKLQSNDTEEYDQGEYQFFHDWNKKMLARQVTDNG
jgi:glyoxylase-like metal-dependent hydrolase (beta-lactamase superfamily II)